ncbi:hypothetical protein DFH07DRAFT_776835 [Mycena maculata]|uniref:Uncharacterized protein n=1 Tax=Mycena maculata TaxID=230809 RepID=A0AAD7IMK7_9AGAR|nr:hypothetical protein DFH07DRAFT_776835 [Mycena maculata]
MVIAALFLPPSRRPRRPLKSPDPDRCLQHEWMGVIVDELEGCNAVWGLTGHANTPAANCVQNPAPNPLHPTPQCKTWVPISVHPPRCKTWVPVPARPTPHAGTATGLSTAEMFIKRCVGSWAATGAGPARSWHSHTPEILHVQDLQRAHLVFLTPTPTTTRPGATCAPLPSVHPTTRGHPGAPTPAWPTLQAKACGTNPTRPTPHAKARAVIPARQTPRGQPRMPKPVRPTPHGQPRTPKPAGPSPRAKARTASPTCPTPRDHPHTANPACPSLCARFAWAVLLARSFVPRGPDRIYVSCR